MTFEEALRLCAGSWVINASLTERRRASTGEGAHGPIGSSCDRDVERLLPRGRWRSQGTRGLRMFYDPQTAFGLVVLGLLCVAVFYVAARSPRGHQQRGEHRGYLGPQGGTQT